MPARAASSPKPASPARGGRRTGCEQQRKQPGSSTVSPPKTRVPAAERDAAAKATAPPSTDPAPGRAAQKRPNYFPTTTRGRRTAGLRTRGSVAPVSRGRSSPYSVYALIHARQLAAGAARVPGGPRRGPLAERGAVDSLHNLDRASAAPIASLRPSREQASTPTTGWPRSPSRRPTCSSSSA